MLEEENREPLPYSMVDAFGRVMASGKTLVRPVRIGCETLDIEAPADSYWSGIAFVSFPAQPSAAHVWDWPSHQWIDSRSLADAKEVRMAAATDKRWQVESGGITLPGGVLVSTTKADQDRIAVVLQCAERAGVDTIDFKAASGWTTLSIAQLQDIASAIALHVQACFSAERAHHEAIDQLRTLAAIDAYDINAGWPDGRASSLR